MPYSRISLIFKVIFQKSWHFNPWGKSSQVQMFWHPACVIPCFILCYVDFIQPIQYIIMASKTTRWVTNVLQKKRKHATLMIPQKLEIILTLDKGKSCCVITTTYNVGMSTINDIKKEEVHLWSFMALTEVSKDFWRDMHRISLNLHNWTRRCIRDLWKYS